MQSFKDRHGRAWQVEINVALAKRVRNLLGVDLYRLVENDFAKFQELLRDQITLIDVVYVLCKDQADALKISDEQFGGGLAGETVAAAADAFVEAFINFSPDPKAARLLRSMKQKGLAAVEILQTEAQEKIDYVTAEMLVEEAKSPGSLATRLSAKFGNSPAPSPSTQAPLPWLS